MYTIAFLHHVKPLAQVCQRECYLHCLGYKCLKLRKLLMNTDDFNLTESFDIAALG
jgi:hypothetical protein